MSPSTDGYIDAGAETPRRLFVYSGGFLTQPRIRRILTLAGWRISLGLPENGEPVGVWGASPTSHRGKAVAENRVTPVIRIEDPFLRSLHLGRDKDPPMGLLIDQTGVHFDPSRPSDLETLLATHPLDDAALMKRARGAMARMAESHLSKYAATRPDIDPPEPGYVLVIDQTEGDAAVIASGGDRSRFLEMLTVARLDHPNARIIIKSHPETIAGHRSGYFRDSDAQGSVSIYDGHASPKSVLDGAIAVYAHSSQMGFEAILAGHRPRIFGQPFYTGWGLTEDEDPLPRRARRLTRAQLFAAAMILYPTWYDPYRDQLCEIEHVLGALEAQTRAWREDRDGWVASGMRLWKRGSIQGFFGGSRSIRFVDPVQKARSLADQQGRRCMIWANTPNQDAGRFEIKTGQIPDDKGIVRVEDGFVRSRGLGASLVPPLSLVLDDLGIYYDPTCPSRLEKLIATRAANPRYDLINRAQTLMAAMRKGHVTKYNLDGSLPDLPKGPLILVPGQVEDDASILKGAPDGATNALLLERVRALNPSATILYKPHPDVEAGLRPGVLLDETDADLILRDVPLAALLDHISEVWTWTSLTGFEALLRGVSVTTLGTPFYAGWGLTRDLGTIPARRLAGPRPTLDALVHATLIDYPRYHDPVTGLPCPVEIAVERLISHETVKPGTSLRMLSKLQGAMASLAFLWRK